MGQGHLTNSQAANYESLMVRYPPRAPGFSRVQSARPNHHAIIYHPVANSRLAMLVVSGQFSINLGHISLSSHYTEQFSLPHNALKFSGIHPPGGLGRHLVESSPTPASCSHTMEVSWPSGNCPDYPSSQLPFASEPTSNRSPHRQ